MEADKNNGTAVRKKTADFPVKWYALLPLPILILALIILRAADLRQIYEFDSLRLVLSFIFYTLVSLGTIVLLTRNFMGTGTPGLLLLLSGVILWSLAGTVGDAVSRGNVNINVTIFNTCILVSGMCNIAGSVLLLKPHKPAGMRLLWLTLACGLTVLLLWLVSYAALSGWLPVFFVQGQGGTPLRQFVLISAISMLVLSAGILHTARLKTGSSQFVSWYSLALLLLATGLFGVMVQSAVGSAENWVARIAQWLGGVYLLVAAVASMRESSLTILPSETKTRPAYYRDAVAVATVLAAAAMRLVFLSAMDIHAPFVIFYPAVMFASLYGGMRAGLIATALSAFLADYFWIPPSGLFMFADPADWLGLIIFLLGGWMISWMADSMHSAHSRASIAETQALLSEERIKASETMWESRARLEAALASMNDAVLITDSRGEFINFNDAFALFYKFRNKEECVRALDNDPGLIEAASAGGAAVTGFRQAVPAALKGESAENEEYRLQRRDTGEKWIGSYSYGPIRDKDGVITGAVVVARDITDKKRAENALKESSEKIAGILESIQDGFFELDKNWRFTFINKRPVFDSGRRPEQLLGRTIWEIFPGMENSRFGEIFRRVMETRSAEKNTVTENSKQPVHYELNVYPSASGISVFWSDVTERIGMENKLRFQVDILESINDAIVVTDLKFNITSWNKAAERIYEWKEEEVLGKPSDEIIRSEISDRVRADYYEKLAAGTPIFTDLVQLTKSGRKIYVAGYTIPAKNEAGETAGYAAINHDVTEQKRAEAELMKKEADLSEAQRIARVGSWYWNAADDSTTGSDELKRIYGIDPSAEMPAFGDQDGTLYAHEDWLRLSAAVQEAAANGTGYDMRVRAFRAGVPIWIRTRSEAVKDSSGKVTGLRGTVQDITELKTAEEVLERDKETLEKIVKSRSEELERARRLSDIGTLSATVAHELRNPLAAISVAVYNIKRKAPQKNLESHINNIQKKVTESDQIINNLLFYSRLKPPHAVPVNAAELLEESAGAAAEKHPAIAITKKFKPLEKTVIEADPVQLREVFNNVLNNACDAVPEKGGKVEIKGTESKDKITIIFSDNGSGVDKEIISKVFNPFFTTKAKGTGLGLSVCRQIVEMHGGSITMESSPFRRTKVEINLPKWRI